MLLGIQLTLVGFVAQRLRLAPEEVSGVPCCSAPSSSSVVAGDPSRTDDHAPPVASRSDS